MRGFSKTVLTVCENRFLTQFAPEIYKEKELIKRWGNAVSQRNFLNYTRHSFASLFNPYFLHLKIFIAKTNINCCRTEIYSIDFIDFIGLFAENLQFSFQEKEKKEIEIRWKKKERSDTKWKKWNNRDSLFVHRSLLSFWSFLTDSFITARSKTRNEQLPRNERRIFRAEEKSIHFICLLTIKKHCCHHFYSIYSTLQWPIFQRKIKYFRDRFILILFLIFYN